MKKENPLKSTALLLDTRQLQSEKYVLIFFYYSKIYNTLSQQYPTVTIFCLKSLSTIHLPKCLIILHKRNNTTTGSFNTNESLTIKLLTSIFATFIKLEAKLIVGQNQYLYEFVGYYAMFTCRFLVLH